MNSQLFLSPLKRKGIFASRKEEGNEANHWRDGGTSLTDPVIGTPQDEAEGFAASRVHTGCVSQFEKVLAMACYISDNRETRKKKG
jgi:hypothetical protein